MARKPSASVASIAAAAARAMSPALWALLLGVVVVVLRTLYTLAASVDWALDPVFDQPPFWTATIFIFTVPVTIHVVVVVARAEGQLHAAPLSSRTLLWLQLFLCTGVLTYVHAGDSLGLAVLAVLPSAGALLYIPLPLQLVQAVVGAGFAMAVIADESVGFGFRRFHPGPQTSEIVVSFLLATAVSLGASFVTMKRYEHAAKAQEETLHFTRVVLSALLKFHFSKAEEEITTRLEEDPDDEVAATLVTFTEGLRRWAAYIPETVRDPRDDDSDDDFSSDEDDDGQDVLNRLGDNEVDNVASSGPNQLRRRPCTLLHVEVFNCSSDSVRGAVAVASKVMEAVIPRVVQFDGVIDSLSPHSVVASFNSHRPCPLRHTKMACQAALAIAGELELHPDLEVAIALDTGYNLAGHCGVETRRAEVVMGDSVDLVRRLTPLASTLHAPILVTDSVVSAVRDQFDVFPVDAVVPEWHSARPTPITLYNLTGLRSRRSALDKLETCTRAFSALREGRFLDAHDVLEQAAETMAHPHIARMMAVCSELQDLRPPREYLRREQRWEYFMAERTALRDRSGQSQSQDLTEELAPVPRERSLSMTTDRAQEAALGATVAALNQKSAVAVAEPAETGFFDLYVEANAEDDADNGGDDKVPPQFEDGEGETWQRGGAPIGEGAFSTVFLGLDRRGALAAMKCFLLSAKQTNVQELQKEVTVLAKLQHHNIVAYVSCALTASHFIIVMEHISGGSLHAMLKQFGPLPVAAVQRYLKDILLGLRYLHDNGIVHCDLKPHNALLSNDSVCKLSDFGSALNTTTAGADAGEEDLTVRGTSWYMAPEAARNEILPASDVWSVGITVIELLAGQQPWGYRGSEANFIRELGKNEEMVPPIPDALPDSARDFVARCLVRDPLGRATVNDLLVSPFVMAA